MDWTDDKVELLEALWNADIPVRAIAERLGDGCTKSAVIGKANRLGLQMHAGVTSGAKRRAEIQQRRQTIARILGTNSQPRTCQWPMWDNVEPPTHEYCGAKVKPGRPYCSAHCERAYRVAEPKRDPMLYNDKQNRPAKYGRLTSGMVASG